MRNQKGFTLIELIIVIVVLGILAVTAAPQFINFSGDARESTVRGLKGALSGSAQTVYGKASIAGLLGADEELDLDDDGTSDVSLVNGYPAADVDGIIAASNMGAVLLEDGYDESQDWVYRLSPNEISIAPSALFAGDDLSGGASYSTLQSKNCYAKYVEASSSNKGPEISVVVSGCGD
mgnify:CR=1 FL=1